MKKIILLLLFLSTVFVEINLQAQQSIAREWNELLLESIRNDLARPTVHARNLFHTSVAMYDVWAAYDNISEPYFLGKTVNGFSCPFNGIATPADVEAAREEAISYAMYRLLDNRFNNFIMQNQYTALMSAHGYSTSFTSTDYSTGSPAALGNYVASQLIAYGMQDGSNQANDYSNTNYQPLNTPMIMDYAGNPNISDLNRWQPLTLEIFIDQSGNIFADNTPGFLSPEWGNVSAFAVDPSDVTTYQKNGFDYPVCLDPGSPPLIDIVNGGADTEEYQWNFALTSAWSSHLDANDPTLWDISPASIGNIQSYPNNFTEMQNFYDQTNGGDASVGHSINPHTGQPYAPQMVKRADYTRVLAEFWADGPDSETPPGHWFTILHYVSDHPLFEKKFEGTGDLLNDLEWDVKSYFTLSGALHDAAIAAWGCKGWYDYIRPVSAIRAMAELGQSSSPSSPSYHVGGLPLITNYIELVNMGDPLAGTINQNIGKVKVKAWKGPDYISNPATTEAGVDWILAENWWPYQRPSFVTPNFAGYVSGHSTFSRAAAEVLTAITGDPFFPGGMGEFFAPQNEFLVFEDGPSQDITLQWATYRDASDQCSLSRIWGGIHPPADDIPGRLMGIEIGQSAFTFSKQYITARECSLDIPLNAGWNIISSNCIPSNLDMEIIFASIASNVRQVKDLSDTYIPTFGFNGIGDWDITKSYQVKVDNPVTLQIPNGAQVEPSETPINLQTGWNEMAYFLDGESDPVAALSGISANIVQVKNLVGSYIPTFNFSDLGNLIPGQGYQTKMSANDVLYYNESNILPNVWDGTETPQKSTPSHFELAIPKNPFSETLLLLDENQNGTLKSGDEIGIFNSNGLLVGSGIYENGQIGILIYGDDPETAAIDGMIEGEKYLVKLFKSNSGTEQILSAELADIEFIQGGNQFEINGLSVVHFKTNATGIHQVDNLQINIHPNPAKNQLHFKLQLVEDGNVSISVYDVEGRAIEQVLNTQMQKGSHSIPYQLGHLTPGLYTYRFILNGKSLVERFVVY